MRIGVMLREIANQVDAPGIIVLNLLDHLLEIDNENEYILFYRTEAYIDRYATHPNVRPMLVTAPNKLLWDQFAVPTASRREAVDVVFHPKHSLPLSTGCRTVMQLRGSEYWVYPEFYDRTDLLYQRTMLPLFARKADHIIVESEFVRNDFQRFLHVPSEKMTTIYLAPDDRFRVVRDPEPLAAAADAYDLPGEFIFTVTRLVQGRHLYPGKNLIRAIRAYGASRARHHVPFVIAGRGTREILREQLDEYQDLEGKIIPIGAVPQGDLPAIYSRALLFLFPSLYESFGLPIAEAMACGCPVITSTSGACPEVAGDAALLVEPTNVDQISDAIDRIAEDEEVRTDLSTRGLARAKTFTWRKAAEETLRVLTRIGPGS